MTHGPAPVVMVRELRVDGLLDQLSFDLGAGECLAITDEHDLRRTALLQCIAGTRVPDGGRVTAPPSAALWHDDGLPDGLPVARTIEDRLGADASAMLAELGLQHRAEHEPWAMSAGERRRIATELVLRSDAPLIVLDEPERGLDRTALAGLSDRLGELLAAGRIVALATHSEWLAEAAGSVVVDDLGKRASS